ncbi:MAG: type I-E CRISPR-associated protein Cas5/CasD [Deltaproteobacteria bacterium]|nr:type I-E CRISPR-associated protein Cas5/CasD [Deltaproteobacteria bacterium]
MNDYLLLRLYGALASWGDIAVGDIRPSYRYPSKSSVIGLIAAALGIARDKHEKQTELAKLFFSVRIDALGSPIEDYHTIQTPSEQAIKNDRTKPFWTRIDEIEAIQWRVIQSQNNTEAGAIQSRRTYYCDSAYTVALCENENDKINWHTLEISMLQDLIEFIKKPRFVLYLGRKSCPLGLPLEPQVISAKNCRSAFQQAKFGFFDELKLMLKQATSIQYYTQEDIENSQMKLTRRDQPVNRTTWQFTERDEYYFSE